MVRRRLSPDEQALWQRLTSSVRPIRARQAAKISAALVAPSPDDAGAVPVPVPVPQPGRVKGRVPPPRPEASLPSTPARDLGAPLDNSWERRIRSGMLQPERSIDLHGHSLAMAHAALDAALARAVATGVRVLLVVTGKPRPGGADGSGRGAIRAEIGHWLDGSPYADRIASVRGAHPRHGGQGALYVILRRVR